MTRRSPRSSVSRAPLAVTAVALSLLGCVSVAPVPTGTPGTATQFPAATDPTTPSPATSPTTAATVAPTAVTSAPATAAPTTPPSPTATTTPAATRAASPGATGSPAASPSGPLAPAASTLQQAAAFLPPGSPSLYFTDWSAIKRSIGAEDVTSQSPIEERTEVGLATTRGEAAASSFSLRYLLTHAVLWGFDTMDFEWEAVVQSGPGGLPVFILRFREGFDLAAVAARFDEREFTSEPIDGGVLRSHDLDLTEDWVRGSELAIRNTAFLDDGRTLVSSGDADAVRDVVAAAADPGARTLPALAVLESLTGASAAIVFVGDDTCDLYVPTFGSDEQETAARQELAEAGPLSRYGAMGVGYLRDWEPVGRVVFGYADAATAAADLRGRRMLAEEGTSRRAAQPYAEAVFTLADAHVDEALLSLEVRPVDDMPRRLVEMVLTRDMLFAACPA